MSSIPRVALGNIVYHVLNRANSGFEIFRKDADYGAFEVILAEVKNQCPMRILAYCLMPNHWHLVLYPYHDNDLPRFMQKLTLTHAKRWRTHYESVGYGHVYQGRYKSFPIQQDQHFLQVCRYAERNAFRAGLVARAEEWRWSSVWRRTHGNPEEQKLLDSWPVEQPAGYLDWLNEQEPKESLQAIRECVRRKRPYGEGEWMQETALSTERSSRCFYGCCRSFSIQFRCKLVNFILLKTTIISLKTQSQNLPDISGKFTPPRFSL